MSQSSRTLFGNDPFNQRRTIPQISKGPLSRLPDALHDMIRPISYQQSNCISPMDSTDVVTGTAVAKYYPTIAKDFMGDYGSLRDLNVKIHCITAQEVYKSKSLEELRFEDYTNRNKLSSAKTMTQNEPINKSFGKTAIEVKSLPIDPNFTGIGEFGFPGGISQPKPLVIDPHRSKLVRTDLNTNLKPQGVQLLKRVPGIVTSEYNPNLTPMKPTAAFCGSPQNTIPVQPILPPVNAARTFPQVAANPMPISGGEYLTRRFYGNPQNTIPVQPILQPVNTAGTFSQVYGNVAANRMPISGGARALNANYGYYVAHHQHPPQVTPKTIHEQILARITCPYEENPMWKDLKQQVITNVATNDASTSVTNLNGNEQTLDLNCNQFRIENKVSPLPVKMNAMVNSFQQLSLTDVDLNDNDFILKPNRKSLLAKRIVKTRPYSPSSEYDLSRQFWLHRKQQNDQVAHLNEPSSSQEPVPTITCPPVSDNLYPIIEKEDEKSHPTGIVQTRTDYYTIPSLNELILYLAKDGSCVVPNFTVGREGYGNVYFGKEIDVAGLNLDEIIHFNKNEVDIYPDNDKKPPVGQGLNRKAQITLDNIWPKDKITNEIIKDPKRLFEIDWERKLRRNCEKNGTQFIDYRPETGSWVFLVKPF